MPGSEKLPGLDRLHPELRFLGQPPIGSAASSAPVPHPFIPQVFPWLAGNERQNRGLTHFSSPISHPNSAAALVAFAASRYVDKNLSSQILRNFQKPSFDPNSSVNSSNELSLSAGERSPVKKTRHQFDVDTLSGNSPPLQPAERSVLPASQCIGAHYSGASSLPASPFHSAWQQFLFRFRNLDNSLTDQSADSQVSFGNHSTGTGIRFGSESIQATSDLASKGRRLSDDVMTGVDQAQEENEFQPNQSKTSSATDGSRPGWKNSHKEGLANRGKLKVVQSSALQDVFTNSLSSDTAKDISPDRKLSFKSFEMASDDSLNSTNRRCSSASSDQSRDENQHKRKRKRATASEDTCPVCGITVRTSDLQNHMLQEMEKLEKIPSEAKRKYGSNGQLLSERRSCAATSSIWSGGKRCSDRNVKKVDRINRLKTYQKVRSNRLERLNSRVGRCLRSTPPGGGESVLFSESKAWPSSTSWSTHLSLPANCPVCCLPLVGSQSSMHEHIGRCLRQRNVCQQIGDEETEVDVESSDHLSKPEELGNGCHGNLPDGKTSPKVECDPEIFVCSTDGNVTSGTSVMKPRDLQEQSERFLNVETDDTQMYGQKQYNENDLLGVKSLSEEENNCEKNSSTLSDSTTPPSVSIVSSLQSKIEKLENDSRSTQCMICMGVYKDPVTSIQCWHVHCERCWLKVLSVKKLCPQCNTITPLNKLRRIFL